MNPWLIVLIVVVVVGLALLALLIRSRKRRETSGAIGLPPIGAITQDDPGKAPKGPEGSPRPETARPAENPSR